METSKLSRLKFRLWSRQTMLILILLAVVILNGCVLTKLVTTPMRIGGAIISIVPVVGNTVDGTIDEVADVIDDIPI